MSVDQTVDFLYRLQFNVLSKGSEKKIIRSPMNKSTLNCLNYDLISNYVGKH